MYIRQVLLSRVICQDPSHLTNTLANINSLLVSDLHYLANTLIITDDKAGDFTKENDNLIPWQVDNTNTYGVDGVRKWGKTNSVGWGEPEDWWKSN